MIINLYRAPLGIKLRIINITIKRLSLLYISSITSKWSACFKHGFLRTLLSHFPISIREFCLQLELINLARAGVDVDANYGE